MNKTFFTIDYVEKQEAVVKTQTENFFGKERNGFCDYALNGIELMLQALQLWEPDELSPEKEFKSFTAGLRYIAFLHYYRVYMAFKATYNLFLSGYYTEASILLRSIVETFVKLRYIEISGNKEYLITSMAGHHGYQGKKFTITYENQFTKVAPGLYNYYRLLCDMSHGALASVILKSDQSLKVDDTLIFKPEEGSFVVNQFSVYLLAHLEYLMHVFPEVKKNMPDQIAAKFHKTLSTLWALLEEISRKEQNKNWYEAVRHLVKV